MALTIKKKLANKANYGAKKTGKNKYIVEHYTAGSVDTDENNGVYFARENVGVSANYFVDDDSATLSVPDDYVAYHCGKDYSNGKAPYWGKVKNDNSIGIEMAGISADKNLDIRNKTIANAVALTKKLMKKYSISIKNVVRHYDVAGKNCPAPLVKDKIAWECFKLNCETPYKVKTTKENVKMRKTLGGSVVKKLPLGKTINVEKVYIKDGVLYGRSKSSKRYFNLKNTKRI